MFQDKEDTSLNATAHPADMIDLAELLSPSLCETGSFYEGAKYRDMFRVSYTLAMEENNNSIEAAGPSLAPAVAPFADSPVDVYLDLDEWLQPSLCEIVGAAMYGKALDKQFRQQRVAALRARWVDRPFTGLSWLPGQFFAASSSVCC